MVHNVVLNSALHTTVCAPHITQEENPIVLSFSGKAVVGTLRRHICKVHPLAKLRQGSGGERVGEGREGRGGERGEGRGSIQQHTTDCDLYANIPCSL